MMPLPEPFWWWGLGEEDFASLTPELAQKYEQLFPSAGSLSEAGQPSAGAAGARMNLPAEKPRTKPSAEHDR